MKKGHILYAEDVSTQSFPSGPIGDGQTTTFTHSVPQPPESVKALSLYQLLGKLHNVMRRGRKGVARPLVRPPGGAPEGEKSQRLC